MSGMIRGWTSTAARLTSYLLQAKNNPPRIGTALASRYNHCPAFAREGQFLLDPLAFEKQALALGSEKRLGQTEQAVERRTGAGGYDIDLVSRDRLDSARADDRVGLGDANSFAQEGGFSRIGLDQLDTGHPEDRQNQPGQAGAGTEIDQIADPVGQK